MSNLNDPRVLLAAERTLLAWNRTSLTLMGFGFVIERFGLFVRLMTEQRGVPLERGPSFWVGIAFILIGAGCAVAGILQYRKVLKSLRPAEIPEGYRIHLGVWVNVLVAVLGVALTTYLYTGSGW